MGNPILFVIEERFTQLYVMLFSIFSYDLISKSRLVLTTKIVFKPRLNRSRREFFITSLVSHLDFVFLDIDDFEFYFYLDWLVVLMISSERALASCNEMGWGRSRSAPLHYALTLTSIHQHCLASTVFLYCYSIMRVRARLCTKCWGLTFESVFVTKAMRRR